MRFIRTAHFKEEFERLTEPMKRSAEKALRFFAANPRHPSLQAKKIGGQCDPDGRNIWEARVSKGYRFTFVFDGDTVILYRIGPHDIERHPW